MALEKSASTATTKLQLASPNGPVTRLVLQSPPRDALPSEIPVIDISSIFNGSFDERKAVAQKIREAATNIGFFYISGHGVPTSVIENAYDASLDFFHQDIETKIKAKSPDSDNYVGYFPPRTMKINPFEGNDVKEMFICRYDPNHDPSVENPEDIPEHVQKHFHYEDTPWDATATVPHFKDAVIKYYQAGLALTRALARSFALSLDLPEDYFDEKMRYPNINGGVNYYPPIQSPGKTASTVSSFGSHTDFQVFTVLWQDSTGGLQVLNREGQWINARPIPGTFVVNIADLLQRMTNDLYVSTVHRAQNWSNQERISMTFFTGFSAFESVGVVDTCVGPDGEKKYEDITVEAWVTRRLENMIRLEKEMKALEATAAAQ